MSRALLHPGDAAPAAFAALAAPGSASRLVPRVAPTLHHARGPTPVALRDWVLLDGRCVAHAEGGLTVSGWSHLLATDAAAGDGVLVIDATLDQGPGFGVLVRTALDGDQQPVIPHDPRPIAVGWCVQVDPGYGRGALAIRRWHDGWESHPIALTAVPRDQLLAGHRLTISFGPGHIRASWGDAVVAADLVESSVRLGRAWAAVDGEHIGLRTWGATLLHVWGAELT